MANRFQLSDTVRERAVEMIGDGASHTDIARTLGIPRELMRVYFPGTGWTPQQKGAHGRIIRDANLRARGAR